MARRLALDANLLVLLSVGLVAPTFISRHKRLNGYSETDLDLLTNAIQGFRSVLVTPSASAEASNLIVYGVSDPLQSQFRIALGAVIQGAMEIYEPSANLVRQAEFVRHGLADAALLTCLGDDVVLLTADRALYLAALRIKATAYLFEQLKRHRRGRL